MAKPTDTKTGMPGFGRDGSGARSGEKDGTVRGAVKEIAERDERLVSAFFDGELSPDEVNELELRFRSEPGLRRYCNELGIVRRGVHQLLREPQGVDAEARRDALWARLELELRPDASRGANRRPAHGGAAFLDWCKTLWAGRAGSRVRPVALSLGVAAVALMVVVRSGGAGSGGAAPDRIAEWRAPSAGSNASESTSHAMAANGSGTNGSGPLMLVSEGGRTRNEQLILSEQLIIPPGPVADFSDGEPPFATAGAAAEPQQDLLARVGIDDIPPVLNIDSDVPEDLVGRLMPPSGVVAARQLEGDAGNGQLATAQPELGYRAGGVDISWIRSDGPVRLVSSKRQTAAPVVWVGRTGTSR